MRKRLPTSVDLFAGCGGMALGGMQAGLNVVAAVEWNTTAALTYAHNLCRYGEMQFHFLEDSDQERMERELQRAAKGRSRYPRAGTGWISHHPRRKYPGTKHIIIGDISLLSGALLLHILGMKPGELDHMHMSPPCQGFSRANISKNKANDPRNDLCFEGARLVMECQPKTITLENVPQFADSRQCDMFKKLLSGGPEAVETFEALLPTHPHWSPMICYGPELVAAMQKEMERKAA